MKKNQIQKNLNLMYSNEFEIEIFYPNKKVKI